MKTTAHNSQWTRRCKDAPDQLPAVMPHAVQMAENKGCESNIFAGGFRYFMIAMLGATLLGACASSPSTVDTGSADHVLAALRQKHPGVKVDAVRATPLPGIYEVQSGRSLAYTDAEGRYVFVGTLLDTATHRNLTAEREREINRIDFAMLPLEEAIVFKQGNGRRTLAVFSDPNCPYCRRLEPELAKLTDTTIYLFLYPIDALHPGASAVAQSIWCAPDRASAWRAYMLQGVAPKSATCANPIGAIASLGATLRFTGTPTLVSGDGRVLSGARPSGEILAWLDAKPVQDKAQ